MRLTHKTIMNTAAEYLSDLISVQDKSTTVCTRVSLDTYILRAHTVSKVCANSFLSDRLYMRLPVF